MPAGERARIGDRDDQVVAVARVEDTDLCITVLAQQPTLLGAPTAGVVEAGYDPPPGQAVAAQIRRAPRRDDVAGVGVLRVVGPDVDPSLRPHPEGVQDRLQITSGRVGS